MTYKDQRSTIIQRLLPLVALTLFALALWVLHDALRQFQYHHILGQLKEISTSHTLTALGITVLSYLMLTIYDQLAISYIQHPLSPGRVTLASFISYAFSNTVGLSLLTAGTIRYRLYSAWGLSTEEIVRLVSFTALTFCLGIVTVGGIVFVTEPMAMPLLERIGIHSARPIGLTLVALVVTYLLFVSFRKKPFHFCNWEFSLPSLRLAWSQLLVGSLDWTLAGCVLFVLLPEQAGFSFFQFLGIYLLAQIVALISNVPGGLGVFESMVLISAPQVPADALLSSMLIYRGIYYLLPLSLAALLLAGNELLQRRSLFAKAFRQTNLWWGIMIPPLMAAATLVSGTVLLFSGATPAVPGRLH